MLTTKQITGLLYSMGHTFDNLASTYIATEEFLTTNDPHVIGSRGDLALLQDLQAASRCMLHYDYSHGLTLDFIRSLNASMTRTAALDPGALRKRSNIMVHTMKGDYIPPIPDENTITTLLSDATRSPGSLIDAARLFAQLAKIQPFGDGNKRTALLAANGLLIMRHQPHVLTVPVTDPEKQEFNTKLSAWYLDDDPQVIDLLASYNTRLRGLDRQGHPIPTRAQRSR